MASCRLSSEIEGAKNRLSPLQQKSRIPVRIVNHLNNNSGKSSSSKDEVNIKQRILKNRLEKSQNKPPSRIPVPISRTNSKDVGRDKIPKTVITVTGKKPLGTITGIVDICIVFKAFSLRRCKSSSRIRLRWKKPGARFFTPRIKPSLKHYIFCLEMFFHLSPLMNLV